MQFHIVKAISLVWCVGLRQTALIFQFGGMEGLPPARQLKILYSGRVYVCTRGLCVRVRAYGQTHTRRPLIFLENPKGTVDPW